MGSTLAVPSSAIFIVCLLGVLCALRPLSHVPISELSSWVAKAERKCASFAFNNRSSSVGKYELSDVFHGHGNHFMCS